MQASTSCSSLPLFNLLVLFNIARLAFFSCYFIPNFLFCSRSPIASAIRLFRISSFFALAIHLTRFLLYDLARLLKKSRAFLFASNASSKCDGTTSSFSIVRVFNHSPLLFASLILANPLFSQNTILQFSSSGLLQPLHSKNIVLSIELSL